PPGGDQGRAGGLRPLPGAQRAEPLLPRLPRAQPQDRSGTEEEDRGLRRDAEARGDDLSQRQGAEAQMTTFVAFLRGVNLGKRRMKMANLRAACEAMGLKQVKTIVASGNV